MGRYLRRQKTSQAGLHAASPHQRHGLPLTPAHSQVRAGVLLPRLGQARSLLPDSGVLRTPTRGTALTLRAAHAHRACAPPCAPRHSRRKSHTYSHRRSPNRNSSPRQVRAVRLVAFAVLLLPGFIPAAFHYWCGAGWFKMAPNCYTTILYHPATLLHYCTIALIHYIHPRRMRSWFKMAACLYEDTTSGPTHRGLHGGTARPYAARRSPGRSRAL